MIHGVISLSSRGLSLPLTVSISIILVTDTQWHTWVPSAAPGLTAKTTRAVSARPGPAWGAGQCGARQTQRGGGSPATCVLPLLDPTGRAPKGASMWLCP